MHKNKYVLIYLPACVPIPARIKKVSLDRGTIILNALPQPGEHPLLQLTWKFDSLRIGSFVQIHDVRGAKWYEGQVVRGYGPRISIRALQTIEVSDHVK